MTVEAQPEVRVRQPARGTEHAALALLVGVALLGPVLQGRVFCWRDLGRHAYPVLAEARHGVGGATDALPLWTHALSSGSPLLANPGNSLLEPLSALYVFLPFDVAFDLFIVLHVLMAACFMAVLARRLGATRPAAFAAGAAYALGGGIVSAANLYPTLAAMAWAPLVLAAAHAAARTPGRRTLALLALTLAACALGGQPEPVVITALAGFAWTLALARGRFVRRCVTALVTWGCAGTLAVALAAPQVVPAALVARHSVRSLGFRAPLLLFNSLDPRQAWELLIGFHRDAPARLMGLPAEGRAWDSSTSYFVSIYLGLSVVALAVLAVVRRRRRDAPLGGEGSTPPRDAEGASDGIGRDPPVGDRARDEEAPWALRATIAGLALAGIVLALGRHLPGVTALADAMPWAVPFRYPMKWLELTFLMVPPLAALGVDRLGAWTGRRALAVVAAGVVALDVACLSRPYFPSIDAAVLSKEPVLVAELFRRSRALGVGDDQWRLHHERRQRGDWPVPAGAVLRTPQDVVAWQHALVLPPTGAPHGVHHAFERSADMLESVDAFERARRIYASPPPEWARLLGEASVLWVISLSPDLAATTGGALVLDHALGPADGLPPGSGFLYRDAAFVPRARLAAVERGSASGEGSASVPSGEAGIAEEDHRGITVRVSTSSPARLVLADAITKGGGWRVEVDGRRARLSLTDGWPSTTVDAGTHRVRFDYRPPGWLSGWVLFALATMLAAAMLRSAPRP